MPVKSKEIVVYDTTLRDGAQGEGISFSRTGKLRFVQRLDAFGGVVAPCDPDRGWLGHWCFAFEKGIGLNQASRSICWTPGNFSKPSSSRRLM